MYNVNTARMMAATLGAPPSPAKPPTSAKKPSTVVKAAVAAKMPQPAVKRMRDNSPYYRSYGPAYGRRPPRAVAAFAGVDGWFDTVINTAKQVIPSHTVAGRLLAGDTKGAAQDAGRLVQGYLRPKTPAAPPPAPATFYDAVTPKNSTQTAMLAVAGLLGVGLVVSMLRR